MGGRDRGERKRGKKGQKGQKGRQREIWEFDSGTSMCSCVPCIFVALFTVVWSDPHHLHFIAKEALSKKVGAICLLSLIHNLQHNGASVFNSLSSLPSRSSRAEPQWVTDVGSNWEHLSQLQLAHYQQAQEMGASPSSEEQLNSILHPCPSSIEKPRLQNAAGAHCVMFLTRVMQSPTHSLPSFTVVPITIILE